MSTQEEVNRKWNSRSIEEVPEHLRETVLEMNRNRQEQRKLDNESARLQNRFMEVVYGKNNSEDYNPDILEWVVYFIGKDL